MFNFCKSVTPMWACTVITDAAPPPASEAYIFERRSMVSRDRRMSHIIYNSTNDYKDKTQKSKSQYLQTKLIADQLSPGWTRAASLRNESVCGRKICHNYNLFDSSCDVHFSVLLISLSLNCFTNALIMMVQLPFSYATFVSTFRSFSFILCSDKITSSVNFSSSLRLLDLVFWSWLIEEYSI